MEWTGGEIKEEGGVEMEVEGGGDEGKVDGGGWREMEGEREIWHCHKRLVCPATEIDSVPASWDIQNVFVLPSRSA